MAQRLADLASSSAVAAHRLSKRYGSVVAVDDVSFEVEAGEIFGIVGPNGAGKTTIVECLQGLRRPDGGDLAGYRERGVLRRFRASAVPVAALTGAQVLVTLAFAGISAGLVIATAALIYDIHVPAQVSGVIVAFALAALTFAAIGIVLGLSMPTARSAQGAGVMAWFVMLILTGAGPPREVMTTAMRWIGDLLPLRYVTLLVQDPWLGFGWNWAAMLAVVAFMAGAALLAAILVRRVM